MQSMRVTVILKDITDVFFKGNESGSIPGLNSKTDEEKLRYLSKDPARFPIKIGSGQFRDRVELNQMLRAPVNVTFELAPRKGYWLAVFEVSPAAPV